MRIITEDNIEQLESMSFSRNIERLLKVENADLKDINMKDIIQDIRKLTGETDIKTPERGELGAFKVVEKEKKETPETPTYAPDIINDSPPYADDINNSPHYAPGVNDSPPYPDESPPYINTSPISPPYHDKSPISETTKGGMSTPNIGDRISIKGEIPNPQDIWVVTHITPDFITVENKSEHPEHSNDTIRVLDKTEILPYQELEYYPQPQPQNQMALAYSSHPQYNPGLPPNISVNPIIKIVNGDDKSSGALDSGTGIPDKTKDNSQMVIRSNNEKPDSPNESKSINIENLDLSKPMIVKKV